MNFFFSRRLSFFRALLLIFCLHFGSPEPTFPIEVDLNGNILQNWIRLSLVGKDQSEIELYFKDVEPAELERVKNRLRLYVLTRLRAKNIKNRLERASEINDIEVIVLSIQDEVRYFGLEDDDILKYDIKEEFGINPFSIKSLSLK